MTEKIKMSNSKYVISLAPHIHGGASIQKVMFGVVLALLPAVAVGVYFFGLQALYVVLVSVIACLLFEYLIQRFLLKIKPTITDGSAVITGILLALNVSSAIPLWILVLGALFAIGIAKLPFGGLGSNLFNPALAARAFIQLTFPSKLTEWPLPFATHSADAISGATALSSIKEGFASGDTIPSVLSDIPSYLDLFLGYKSGSIGEVSIAAILIGAAYLFYRRIITWHIPASFILSVILFSGIFWLINPDRFASPLLQLLSGGLMLGVFFMATDYCTSPITKTGKIIFGIGCGLLTLCIRFFSSYPEGISFAILIMNAFVPLINHYFKPTRFGKEINHA